ncbi:copper resistance protein CopC [Streptomyces sp. NPDC056835]|uniref:copper resistance CopC family protein n=1 Tax=Streptomyces sp. NPDC056835 TaxID=3345956 RepID=UPI003696CDC6
MTSSLPTRAITVGVVACAVLGASALLAPPAHAHTALASSNPADTSTLSAPPGEVALTFNEKMDGAYARVAVTGPDNRSVTSGGTRVKDRTVTQALNAAAPAGRYTVAFRVVSTDGHPVTGSLTYTLAATPSVPPSATAAGPEQAADPSAPATASHGREGADISMAVLVSGVVLIVAAGATVFGLRQRRGRYGA